MTTGSVDGRRAWTIIVFGCGDVVRARGVLDPANGTADFLRPTSLAATRMPMPYARRAQRFATAQSGHRHRRPQPFPCVHAESRTAFSRSHDGRGRSAPLSVAARSGVPGSSTRPQNCRSASRRGLDRSYRACSSAEFRVRQADLNPEHASAVRLALSRYLSRTDERDAPYRALARNYGLLPVLPD
jgi:hypothetical protein